MPICLTHNQVYENWCPYCGPPLTNVRVTPTTVGSAGSGVGCNHIWEAEGFPLTGGQSERCCRCLATRWVPPRLAGA